MLVLFCLTPSCDFAYVIPLLPSLYSSSLILEFHLYSLKFASPKILIIVVFSYLTSDMLFSDRNDIIYDKLLSIPSTSIWYLSLQPPIWVVSAPPKMNGNFTSPNNALVNWYVSIWFGSLSINQWNLIASNSSSLISTCRKLAWNFRTELLVKSDFRWEHSTTNSEVVVQFLGIHLMMSLKLLILQTRGKRILFWYSMLLSHNWFMRKVEFGSFNFFKRFTDDSFW